MKSFKTSPKLVIELLVLCPIALVLAAQELWGHFTALVAARLRGS